MGQNRLSQGSKRWQLQHDGAYPIFKHAHMGMDMYGLKCGISWNSMQEWGKTCAPLGLKSSLIPRKALYRLNNDATRFSQATGKWWCMVCQTSSFVLSQKDIIVPDAPRYSSLTRWKNWSSALTSTQALRALYGTAFSPLARSMVRCCSRYGTWNCWRCLHYRSHQGECVGNIGKEQIEDSQLRKTTW